ncbi:hypothetical protein [Bradyrhizobium sp. SYSU BS000235]|uniref:hypothetical protein n=1 Tax=Bradyrhizobium sp. SYSU BS000235 TaxID=3411332 RepID=UPI003C72CFA3
MRNIGASGGAADRPFTRACIMRVPPVGARPNGSALRWPGTLIDRSIPENLGIELQVVERFSGPVHTDLGVSTTINIVKRPRGRAAIRDCA